MTNEMILKFDIQEIEALEAPDEFLRGAVAGGLAACALAAGAAYLAC
jgi:hypothetical protein